MLACCRVIFLPTNIRYKTNIRTRRVKFNLTFWIIGLQIKPGFSWPQIFCNALPYMYHHAQLVITPSFQALSFIVPPPPRLQRLTSLPARPLRSARLLVLLVPHNAHHRVGTRIVLQCGRTDQGQDGRNRCGTRCGTAGLVAPCRIECCGSCEGCGSGSGGSSVSAATKSSRYLKIIVP